MSDQKDVVEIMAKAAYEEGKKHDIIPYVPPWADLPSKTQAKFTAQMLAAIKASEDAGYTTTRSTPGISHPQQPYRGEDE